MTVERQVRFWLISAAVFVVILYFLGGVLTPFVAGMAVAYLLDPTCDKLERWGCSRTIATCIVTAAFILGVAAAFMVIVPLIQTQMVELITRLPELFQALQARIAPVIALLEQRLSAQEVAQLRAALGGQAGTVVRWVVEGLQQLISGGLALFNILSIIFITPVVAFYLLRDWDRLVAQVDGWLPRRHRQAIIDQVRAIDRTLAGFARGQAMVCLVQAIFYSLGLTLVGLDFGLIVGLLAGVLTVIPFVGSITGFVIGLSIAFAQFDSWPPILLVLAVFVVGQVLEGNFLTPKLVGNRIGLHPVWVIFSVLAGGYLFGFVGVLLGLPVAAVIGVLVRFGLSRYLQSPVYHGGIAPETSEPPNADQPPADRPAVGS